MVNKNRAVYIFKYLWDHTDEEHPATTADIIQYLASIVLLEQLRTIDKARLGNYAGRLNKDTMGKVDHALITSLGVKCMEALL